MPSIPHVQRRGAVYYWRRRLPPCLCTRANRSYLVLGLGTKEQAVARRLAAALDSEAAMMMSEGANGSDHRLSPDQLKGMFKKVALEHLQRLDRAAQFDRLQPGFTAAASRRGDIIMGHVYRLLAAGGPEVTVDDANEAGLLKDGLIPTCADHDRCAQSRRPMDMIFQG